MTKTMLIDAAHPEETRVVVVNGKQIEEFDFESQNRKQLRGNIYLAKVSRVEPSLQAAFVEYGGNRHGFLAFNEIHPDYYQIPVADREALMREEAEDDVSGHAADDTAADHEEIETDDDDVMEEEVARRRRRLMRRYKIQEVIKRRQIMLVQVVKEERGTKGAALTTYLSLAGRYGVLMPNTATGGGISRKIAAPADRKRLKGIVQSLDVPQGMGLIVRTAGAKRTKAEISRDYDYLLRLWESIRETTLHSIAPALIYEEEDLVKRAIRDLFGKDVDRVCVEGDAGFREARNFMRMLMPSQAKKIEHHRDTTPLFIKHQVEDSLAQIYSPTVPLRSGGYLVINQTEALVAIDVNSGRSTRERNVEATALKTNLEAAEEAARQIRLRDLAGLIIIDFIDMEEGRNNRAVERVLKDCLALDRARIQNGKISSFGLMEISRQRRRSGVLEGSTEPCPHCSGVGRLLSTESSALAALRSVEGEALKGGGEVSLKVPRDVGLYILNEKRAYLARLHRTHGLFVTIVIDDSLTRAEHGIERTDDIVHHALPESVPALTHDALDDDGDDDLLADEFEEDEEDEEAEEAFEDDTDLADDEDEADDESEDDDEDAPARAVASNRAKSAERPGAESEEALRRRRRRRRGRRGDESRDETQKLDSSRPESDPRPPLDESEDEASRRRRRGRRGGRRLREVAPLSEVYVWTRPRVPFGNDPFIWYDPDVLEGRRFDLTDPVVQTATAPETKGSEPALTALTTATPADSDGDIWVELPELEATPSRSRSRRRRHRGSVTGETSAETTEGLEVDIEAFEAPAPTDRVLIDNEDHVRVIKGPPLVGESDQSPLPVPASEKPQPVLALVATPVQSPILDVIRSQGPDPAEILAPPEQPKRGWWRR